MLKNKSYPQVVPSLEGLFIEDIAVGCEHVLALSSTGDVYAWGCNSEGQVTNILCFIIIHFDILKFALSAHQKSCIVGVCVFQLGLGHPSPVKEPTLITALQGKNIRQISAGRCHSSAWTTPSTSMKNSGTHAVLQHMYTCRIHEKEYTPICCFRLQVALEISS